MLEEAPPNLFARSTTGGKSLYARDDLAFFLVEVQWLVEIGGPI